MSSRSPQRSSTRAGTTLAGREAVILALLVLGIGAGAVLGVLNQPPPRQRTTEVVTTMTPSRLTGTATQPSAAVDSPIPANWQTITLTTNGYRISVPPTWSVRAEFPVPGAFFASYVPAPGGPPVPLAPGDLPPQEAQVDVMVETPPFPPLSTQGDPFCAGSICGLRAQETPRWACTEPACVQQLATMPRNVSVQLVKDGRLYLIHATIGGPPSAMARNTDMVEAILRTFAFVE